MTHVQKRRWIFAGAVALVVLLLAGYVASPWLMLARFKADVQARDTGRMEQFVDFPAVRASIKMQLLAHVRQEIQDSATSEGVANIGMALAGAVIDPAVRVLASPQGLVAMMNGQNPLPGFNRLGLAVPEQAAQPQARVQHEALGGNAPDPGDGGQPRPQQPNPARPPSAGHARKPWRLSYVGLNRVIVQRQPAQAGEPYLLMHRRGLFGWQVVDVQLGQIF